MKYSRILAFMVCVGVYALLAQILLLREFLVVFFGNELTIGAMFSAWLVLVGAGSFLATFLIARWSEERLRVLLMVLLTLAAFLLPLQVWVIRIVRTALHLAYGEYVPFFSMLASLAVILAPGCMIIGIAFPCACRLAARRLRYAVSRVDMVDSLGSMAAGAAFSFWLVWVMSPLAVAALAGAFLLLGAAWLANERICRWLLGLIAFAFAVSACCPVCLGRLERASVEERWRSFGALPPSGSSSPSASRLLDSCDSRYQNLALIETEGQMALYVNGQVMAVFPDAVTGEHKIHFIMAQKPDARRVLLIGGNPINDIPELLKYPLEQLVYVELDEKIGRLLAPVATSAYRQALRDPRLVQIHVDAPRYVKQYGRRSAAAPWDVIAPRFDAILVDASEPATIALNRFYTQDFYRDIRHILSPDGFLYTAVSASEDLQGETAFLSASICAALRTVFDRVLVTFGTQNKFFAGATNSPITLARATLFQRSAGANIKARYFRPEYFLNADEISPEKLDFVERRLAAIPVTANTILKPVSTFYQIALWSRFSGSGLESLLARLTRLRLGWVAGALLGFGVICLGLGAVLGRRHQGFPLREAASSFAQRASADKSVGQDGGQAVFSRSMLVLVMAATGLCGMALELILIFIFQALLGYVYSKVGLIVAMFMLGLSLGAFGAPRFIRRGMRLQWRAMVGMEILLIADGLLFLRLGQAGIIGDGLEKRYVFLVLGRAKIHALLVLLFKEIDQLIFLGVRQFFIACQAFFKKPHVFGMLLPVKGLVFLALRLAMFSDRRFALFGGRVFQGLPERGVLLLLLLNMANTLLLLLLTMLTHFTSPGLRGGGRLCSSHHAIKGSDNYQQYKSAAHNQPHSYLPEFRFLTPAAAQAVRPYQISVFPSGRAGQPCPAVFLPTT